MLNIELILRKGNQLNLAKSNRTIFELIRIKNFPRIYADQLADLRRKISGNQRKQSVSISGKKIDKYIRTTNFPQI